MKAEVQILQTVNDMTPDAGVVLDENGIVPSFNSAAGTLFSNSPQEIVGQSFKLLMPAYFAERNHGHVERFLRTLGRSIISIGCNNIGERKVGSTLPFELSMGGSNTRDGVEMQHYEQRIRELQNELIHVSRLASLGEIATMIAHEVNQPLSAAGTYLEVARELLSNGSEDDHERGLKAVEQAATQILRLGDIIRRTRDFARKKPPNFEVENINQIIEEASTIASMGSKAKNIRTSFALSSTNPLAKVDRIQIQQVIINLVSNALDAIKNYDKREIILKSEVNGEGIVEISVLDSGPGVSDAVAKDLFTPFVTTKDEGMGLGLAICRTIIEAHGGELWNDSSPLGGAAFKFTLPITTNANAEQTDA
jgi:two-component system, LuxR family, sensor kinase FixL